MAYQQSLLRKAQQHNLQLNPNAQRPNPFFVEKSAKRQYFPNHHQNSEEFKDLGTLHLERRNLDYYPVEDFTQSIPVQRKLRIGDVSTPQASSSRKWKQK